ncbi:MAG: hypothetical protein K2N54_03730, partial [Helicobacter sp.]|nr:hypothetical protein [Helicobacter sp.]
MRIFLLFLAVCGILWAKSPKATIEISYKTYTLGENAFLYMASATAPKGKARFLFAGLGGLAQQGCR